MRLNRVLQLTAGVAIAMAATVFTISCSGDEGSSGRDGTACVVVQGAGDNSYNIVCGGSTIGTLVGGTDGAQGPTGGVGAAGTDGTPCLMGEQQADGSYPVYCGNSTTPSGTLNGCTYIENKLQEEDKQSKDRIISCGNTTFGLCNDLVYDPSKQFCPIGAANPTDLEYFCVFGTTKTPFNPAKQYCGYDTKADFTAKKPTVLDICADNNSGVSVGKINEASADNTGKIFGWTSGDTYDGKYCRVSVTVDDAEKLVYSKSPKDPSDCEGSPITPNKNSWKGEYCGYAQQSDFKRKMVNNACADGGAPDSIAYSMKYCAMASKTAKYSTLSELFCDVSATEVPQLVPLNKAPKTFGLTPADWAREYCGFKSKADATAEKPKQSVIQGLCDDGDGPNAASWDNGYCQAKKDSTTVTVGGRSAYCIGEEADFEAVTAADRFNEETWKSEYCGFSSKEAADAGEISVQTGLCGDDKGPNADAWGNEYCQASKNGTTEVANEYCGISAVAVTRDFTGSINQGAWKGEYCGYEKKSDFEAEPKIETVLKGVCDLDGSTPNVGPNAKKSSYTEWLNEYCQAGKNGVTTVVGTDATSITDVYCLADTTGADYSVAPEAARINDKTWKKEYCGFSSKGNFESSTFSKLNNLCDDGNAPNGAGSSSWNNEYCQVDDANRLAGNTTLVGGSTAYCSENAADEFMDLDGSARLNESTWKGEYCFSDFVKRVCTGGKVMNSGTASDDPKRCVFPN